MEEPDIRSLIQESRREVLGAAPEEGVTTPLPREDPQTPAPRPDNAEVGISPHATEPEEAPSFTRLDPNGLPEPLRESYRSMQGDYTRKMQEIAEEKKRLGGIPDTTLEFARTIEQLAATDPQAAARALQAQVDALNQAYGGGHAEPEPPYFDPETGYQPQTEIEAQLVSRLQQLERAQQIQTEREQRARIQGEMAEVHRMNGTPLPVPDQVRVIRYAAERAVTLPEAYRLLNWDTLLQREQARAREEGMTQALQRNGLPPTGGGLSSREAPPPEVTDVKEIAREELRKLKRS